MPGTNGPTVTLTRYADVLAVLNDPRCEVASPPPAEPADSGIAWLRSRVSRFSTGHMHAQRRRLVEEALSRVDPTELRRRARECADRPLDRVPVTVLGQVLGIDQAVDSLVEAAARGYFPGTDGGIAADRAVAKLVTVLGGRFDDATAATIGILIQAHAATASLIAKTLAAYQHADAPVPAVLAETLRYDPPVRVMRRTSITPYQDHPIGTLLELDIAAANRDPAVFAEAGRFNPHRPDVHRHLTFGAGLRPCPGREHALAIATGVVEAVRAGRIRTTRPTSA